MRREDFHRLRHMRDAARQALDFMAGKSRADLGADQQLAFAVVRAIEIIGEAAANLSEEGRALCPGVPWRAVVAMRNRLIHAYFDINLDRVWDTIVDDLPPLIEQLEAILGPDADG